MTQVYRKPDTDEDETVEITVEQYQAHKDMCKTVIAQRVAAQRLFTNEDFQTLVMRGFVEGEAERLTGMIISGTLPEEEMENCAKDLRAIGVFNSYMSSCVQKGNYAEDQLAKLEEAFKAQN